MKKILSKNRILFLNAAIVILALGIGMVSAKYTSSITKEIGVDTGSMNNVQPDEGAMDFEYSPEVTIDTSKPTDNVEMLYAPYTARIDETTNTNTRKTKVEIIKKDGTDETILATTEYSVSSTSEPLKLMTASDTSGLEAGTYSGVMRLTFSEPELTGDEKVLADVVTDIDVTITVK